MKIFADESPLADDAMLRNTVSQSGSGLPRRPFLTFSGSGSSFPCRVTRLTTSQPPPLVNEMSSTSASLIQT